MRCSLWETPEPASGWPAAILAQTQLGLPEVLGAPREPGEEKARHAGEGGR